MRQELSSPTAPLKRLARLYGVQTGYRDMEGGRVETRPETLLAALRAMGAPVETQRDLQSAIEEKLRESWDWQVGPVVVAWEGKLPRVELRLPAAEAQGAFEWRLRLENGEGRRGSGRLENLPRAGQQKIGREDFTALTLPIEGELPLGHHDLEVQVAGQSLTSRVICAPRKAHISPVTKQWGVFLPLYALHTRRGGESADLGDLDALLQWASRQGAGFVGTLPLLASFLEEPFDPSPYAPVSRLFWNELYIDTGPSEGAAASPGLVDYKAAMAQKRSALETEARAFFAGSDASRREHDAYLKQRPEVEDYASFRAATEHLGPNWRAWPAKQRAGELAAADYDAGVARYYAYAQWLADQQMHAAARSAKSAGTELYLDLPVGVHALGYDAWRYQSLFASGMSVGAPPDIVTTSGQNWGFAPLSPEALRSSGYEYVRAYLRHHMAASGMLRVDHVMGLHRLYWIPEGASAKDGVYVRYPFEELYAVHTLESQRNQASITGENLGIVPAQVNRSLAEHGIGRMYVMMIEQRPEQSPPFRAPRPDEVASWGTHDLPPFAAYWQDADIEERIRLGVLTPSRARVERHDRTQQREALVTYLQHKGLIEAEAGVEEIFRGLLALLAQSRSRRLLVNLEDLWLEAESQNVPGTVDEHPNWRRQARYGLEEMGELEPVKAAIATLNRLRPRQTKKEARG